MCQEEASWLRVYMVVTERNKLPNVCLSFDLTDMEVSTNNMGWISRSIARKAHKYFNLLPITWNGDKWIVRWINARIICGRVNDSCIKKKLLLCIEERVDSLDEVLGWVRMSNGGWACTQVEGLSPSWETPLMFSLNYSRGTYKV